VVFRSTLGAVNTWSGYGQPAAAGGTPAAERACLPADNHFDSIISLDIGTGAIKWATSALPFDAWTVACIFDENSPNCPQPAGPDYDFGQAPALSRPRTEPSWSVPSEERTVLGR
jgi:polyvinyl alcohol dehydrogenase (cytochrome)